jgi:hypothetical protein
MPRWQHAFYTLHDPALIQGTLKKLDEGGWELISVIQTESKPFYFFFKRPIEDSPQRA